MLRTLALLALVVLAGCVGMVPRGTPHDATAVFRPASLVADRETAAPGDVVELTFPDEMARGILYVLEEEIGGAWVYRYGLISSGNGVPDWFDPTEEDRPVEDIGVMGPGPDRVVIPPVASPGSWRLCTGNAGENVCVRIEIAPRE